MEFGLTVEIDFKIHKKSYLIHNVSDYIESRLLSKNYGKDIELFLIGCICMHPKSTFFKPREIKYEIAEKYICYDIVLNFEIFKTKSHKEIYKHIFESVINSKEKTKKLTMKVEFDFDSFFDDIIRLQCDYFNKLE